VHEYFHFPLRSFARAQRKASAELVRLCRRQLKRRMRNPRPDKFGFDADRQRFVESLRSARSYARAAQMISAMKRGHRHDKALMRVETYRYRKTRLRDFEVRMTCPIRARQAYSSYHARYLDQERAIRCAKGMITSNDVLNAQYGRDLLWFFDSAMYPDGIDDIAARHERMGCDCRDYSADQVLAPNSPTRIVHPKASVCDGAVVADQAGEQP
jgi:hypothetical protein